MKYQYVRRKNYDYHQDRIAKKFDAIFVRLGAAEGLIQDLRDWLETVDAELESLRLDKTSVRIAGRRDASERRE